MLGGPQNIIECQHELYEWVKFLSCSGLTYECIELTSDHYKYMPKIYSFHLEANSIEFFYHVHPLGRVVVAYLITKTYLWNRGSTSLDYTNTIMGT